MKVKELIRLVILMLACALLSYSIGNYAVTVGTVDRWKTKAMHYYNQKVQDFKDFKVSEAPIPLPEWVNKPSVRVAFDVWLSAASNIASIIGGFISLLGFILSRRRKIIDV